MVKPSSGEVVEWWSRQVVKSSSRQVVKDCISGQTTWYMLVGDTHESAIREFMTGQIGVHAFPMDENK